MLIDVINSIPKKLHASKPIFLKHEDRTLIIPDRIVNYYKYEAIQHGAMN